MRELYEKCSHLPKDRWILLIKETRNHGNERIDSRFREAS